MCCPVCRELIKSDEIAYLQNLQLKLKSDALNPLSDFDTKIDISDKMKKLQKEMKIIYERQKLAGGIIENKEEIIVLNVSFIEEITLKPRKSDARSVAGIMRVSN